MSGEPLTTREPDQQEAFRRLCDVRQRECPHGYRKPEGAIMNPRCIHCVIEQGADGLQRLTDLQSALDASESSRRSLQVRIDDLEQEVSVLSLRNDA